MSLSLIFQLICNGQLPLKSLTRLMFHGAGPAEPALGSFTSELADTRKFDCERFAVSILFLAFMRLQINCAALSMKTASCGSHFSSAQRPEIFL